eukprot:7203705-Prymnesium_polylepis.1
MECEPRRRRPPRGLAPHAPETRVSTPREPPRARAERPQSAPASRRAGGEASLHAGDAAAADVAAGDGSHVERAHARPARRRLVADEGPPPQARCERAGARTGQSQMPLLLGVSSTANTG